MNLSDIFLFLFIIYYIKKRRKLDFLIPIFISYFLKFLFGIKRDICGFYRYPSTHATLFSYISFKLNRFYLFSILGSLLRVLEGCHKILDVYFGFLLGIYIANLKIKLIDIKKYFRKIVHLLISYLAVFSYYKKISLIFLFLIFINILFKNSNLIKLLSKEDEKYYVGPISLLLTYFLLIFFQVKPLIFKIYIISLGVLDTLSFILASFISSNSKSILISLLTPLFIYPYIENGFLFFLIYIFFLMVELLSFIRIKYNNKIIRVDDNFIYLLTLIEYILIKNVIIPW